MHLIAAILLATNILSVLNQNTSESSVEENMTYYSIPGRWINGEFYDDADEDLHVDQRIRTIHFLKKDQPCVTSSGLKGKCRKRKYCDTLGRVVWLSKNSDFCLLRGLFVGVCCPDEISTVGSTLTTPRPTEDVQTISKPSESSGTDLNTNLKSGCGLAPPFEGRIVGGWRVSGEGRWPWIAALMRDNGKTHFCGGTLITNAHILTAAHCLHGLKASDINVRLGEFHLDEPNEAEVSVDVAEMIPYHEYNRLTYENDIAILVLKNRVQFMQEIIWPVCLPPISPSDEEIEENDPLMNRSAIVTGWGSIFYGGPTSPVLLEVEVPIWKQKDCRDAFTQPIMSTVLCAGEVLGGKDSCSGDSGGPLVLMSDSGRWELVGVVSWGIRCAEARKPGVYSRVGKYIDWILDNTS